MLLIKNRSFFKKSSSSLLNGRNRKITVSKRYLFSNPDVRIINDPQQYILAGKGSIDELAIILKDKELNPLIVTDKGVEKAGILSMVKESFSNEGLKFDVWANTKENPPLSDVKEISYAMSKSARNCIVG